jgi:hypothetical protein
MSRYVAVDDFDDAKDVCDSFPCGAGKATCLLADGITLGVVGRCKLNPADP